MKSVQELEHLCLGCMTYLENPNSTCPVCGWNKQNQNEFHQLAPGSVLGGRYLIGRVLGEGGFGITYVGWSIPQEKKVAVKEFFPGLQLVYRDSDRYTLYSKSQRTFNKIFDEGKQKFFYEAQTLARFDSEPNIVSVEDCFFENNTAYIVMEFLPGETFMEYLDKLQRPLSLPATMTILNPIISALERIHAQGFLHRDISPDNIMLSDKGTKLLDFGAAREFSLDGERRNTVYVKLGYAPPEQFFVNGHQGPWTDEHALAATIYHAITGCAPPPATQRGSPDGIDTLQPPSKFGAALTEKQEIALLRGMAVNYKDRYPTISEFKKELIGSTGIVRRIKDFVSQFF